MKTISYARFQERYGGKFIARQNNHILASGKTYTALAKQIVKKHLARRGLTVGYVPPKDAICIYFYAC